MKKIPKKSYKNLFYKNIEGEHLFILISTLGDVEIILTTLPIFPLGILRAHESTEEIVSPFLEFLKICDLSILKDDSKHNIELSQGSSLLNPLSNPNVNISIYFLD